MTALWDHLQRMIAAHHDAAEQAAKN
jgi:hypothetical protein